MIPNKPIVLKGKDARAFEKYQKSPASKEELAYIRESDDFYHSHCPETKPDLSIKRRK